MKRICIYSVGFFLLFTVSAYSEISSEARRHLVRGETAVKMAEDASDYKDAVKEFKKVIEYHPELAEGYYNLSIAQEGAEEYTAAISSLKKYLELAPGTEDGQGIQDKIYELEYLAEKSKKKDKVKKITKPPMSLAERLQGTWYARFKLAGQKNSYYPSNKPFQDTFKIEASGNALKFIDQLPQYYEDFYNSSRGDVLFRLNLAGTELSGIHHQRYKNPHGFNPPRDVRVIGDVMDNGNTIVLHYTQKFVNAWNKGNGNYAPLPENNMTVEVVLKRIWY